MFNFVSGWNRKTVTLLTVIVSVLSLTALAGYLISSGWTPDTVSTFEPVPLPKFGVDNPFDDVEAVEPLGSVQLFRVIGITVGVLVLAAAILLPRRFAVNLLMMALIVLAYYWFVPDMELPPVTQTAAEDQVPLAIEDETPPPEPLPTVETPEWIGTSVAVLFGSVAAAAAMFVAWRMMSPKTTFEPLPAREKLVENVQVALEKIEDGYDLRSAILNCYAQMTNTLRMERGIVRQEAMTAREFETELMAVGLPNRSVSRLTRLFESVRYSSAEPGMREQREAVSCLSEIVTALERPVAEAMPA